MAQTKFAAAGSVVQAAVLARFPFRPFWEAACRALTEANSFRGAESLFRSFIVPFRGTATPDQLVELLAVVVSNLQIFHAAGIPGELAAFADAVGQRNSLHAGQLAAFLAHLDRRKLDGRDTFSGVLDVFAAAGVTIPAAPAAL